jgi:hypothetical protein
LNLEASGRELESIVVGEIQKAYNVLSGIMRREADDSYDTAEKLREGPLAIAKDMEWDAFVTNNTHMVDPKSPVRQLSHITYPGKDHPAALEVKSGMLERKSKYLKNYTPGWYVRISLSPSMLLTCVGTSSHQPTYTSSSQPTGCHRNLLLCRFIFQNRNWVRIPSLDRLPTSSCSKVVKVVQCTVATPGCSAQKHQRTD